MGCPGHVRGFAAGLLGYSNYEAQHGAGVLSGVTLPSRGRF